MIKTMIIKLQKKTTFKRMKKQKNQKQQMKTSNQTIIKTMIQPQRSWLTRKKLNSLIMHSDISN